LSPACTFACVVALVFGVLGFKIVAFAVLGVALLLLLLGFVTPASRTPEQGTGDTPE